MPDPKRKHALLDETTTLVSSGRPLSVVFEQLGALLAASFDVSVIFVALAQPDGGIKIEYALDHDEVRFPGAPIAERSTTSEVARSGRSLLRSTTRDWAGFERLPIAAGDPPTDDSVSAIFVPIPTADRIIGVLTVQSPRESAYDWNDVSLVEDVAELLGTAVSTQRPSLHGERRETRAYTSTIVAALIGLTIAIGAALSVATNDLRARALGDYQGRARVVERSLNDVLDEAREIARNAGTVVPLLQRQRPAVERLTEGLLDASPGLAIDGVGMWWEPHRFDPRSTSFSTYAARIKDGEAATHIVTKYSLPEYDYLHRRFYEQGVHATGVTFSEPYAENGYVFLGAVMPVRDRSGALLGVATADVYGGDFASVLGLSALPTYTFAYITSREGRVVATADDRSFRAFARIPRTQAILDINPAVLLRYVDRRIGTETTSVVARVRSGLTIHLVAGNAGLFAEANGLRGAAFIVIGIIWALGGAIIVLDLRRQRGGRRAQNLEREKFELENEIAERQRAEERLRRFAFYDVLTNLPNRAFLFEHLTRSLERARTSANPFAVLYIDLDRFKIVNDSLGHAVGDELLAAVARRLETSVHSGDVVARIGGDEFVVVLHRIESIESARRVAQRIVERMSESFEVRGSEIYTGASIGIIANADEYASPSDVLRDADVAMYEAKGLGKDRFVLFDRELHMRTVNQLRLETDLRGAVDRNEFVLRYQPIVELATGRLAGFEALVRWQHPERGLLGPTEFIAISEQNRTVVRLGAWVAREAVREFCTWGRPDLTLAINVSVRQLIQANFASDIAAILIAAGMDARAFKIEITESALMEDVEIAGRALRELRDLGVQAHIDDFGTGYSSLSYLRRFPIESIKIDRSFVAEMTQRHEAFEIVRTIVTLASTLGLSVTAEGIETAEQLAACQSLGITYGQGFYLAHPLEPLEAAENAKRSFPPSFAR